MTPPAWTPGQHGDSRLVAHFGTALRQLREAKGWSQERMAERSGLNRCYVGEIERGDVIASLATIEKLAVALQLAPSTLLRHGETLGQHNHRTPRLMSIDS